MGQITDFLIKNEYITLGQFIKLIGLISTGGETKSFIIKNNIKINNKEEKRRGKKIYKRDTVYINNEEFKIC